MSIGRFLRHIWPSEGFYCIAHPWITPDGDQVFSHKTFDNQKAAIEYVFDVRGRKDCFYAVGALAAHKVYDPNKTDRRTGVKGCNATRTKGNIAGLKAFFVDLDVGADGKKYPSQGDAIQGLKDFCAAAQLPLPLLASSGGGIHAYWVMDAVLPTHEWQAAADTFKTLTERLGLKADPTRTADPTSVLRVADTFNLKHPNNPRPVRVLIGGKVTPAQDLIRMIADAVVRAGGLVSQPKAPAAANPFGTVTTIDKDFGPPPTLAEVAAVCGQVREMLRSPAGRDTHDNTAWYRGIMQTWKFVEDGENWCRKSAVRWPRDNADVEAKIVQLERYGPASCQSLAGIMHWGAAPCEGCKFRGLVPNPIVAARKTTPAPAPQIVNLVPGMQPVVQTIPDPPAPFSRLKSGGIARTAKDQSGDETTDVIYPYDLYPLRRQTNAEAQQEQQVWRVNLPRTGDKDFVLDADALYDSRKFLSTMAHQGIYPAKGNIPYLQDYMVAYITQLQREADAEIQHSHLGWTDDFDGFILPDQTLMADGSAKPTYLSQAAARSSAFIGKCGNLQTQVALYRFWEDPAYVANQVMIISGLAAPLMEMTGLHGIIVNASGHAGSFKSTSLYCASAHWGDPKMYPLNGTNSGATPKARAERVSTFANLPICVDEITHLPQKDAQDLAMGITQPAPRIRLQANGMEAQTQAHHKATIMLSTANSSLHGLLSQDNSAGTAGSMRVFEMVMRPVRVHTKPQADDMFQLLMANYGHTGPAFVALVMQKREAVAKRIRSEMARIDTTYNIAPAERFWSAYIACILVACEIAQALGLLNYSRQLIENWLCSYQLPLMRGTVEAEYSTPLSTLTDFLATIQGNMLVTVELQDRLHGGSAVNALLDPRGALYAQYDTTARTIFVLKKAFKDYCTRVGASSVRIVDELSLMSQGSKLISNKTLRRTLGAGLDKYAKGQSWCFTINVDHPDLAGVQVVPTI